LDASIVNAVPLNCDLALFPAMLATRLPCSTRTTVEATALAPVEAAVAFRVIR
jgi:hypothetical protein